jgi:hypothetical protein
MLRRSPLIFAAVALAAVPVSAEAGGDAIVGGSQARKELNTPTDNYGYYPGRRSFYGYPRHRHIDGPVEGGSFFGRPANGNDDRSLNYDRNYGSAYYGTNYGAPYFGGGYYDRGLYYRERRD